MMEFPKVLGWGGGGGLKPTAKLCIIFMYVLGYISFTSAK